MIFGTGQGIYGILQLCPWYNEAPHIYLPSTFESIWINLLPDIENFYFWQLWQYRHIREHNSPLGKLVFPVRKLVYIARKQFFLKQNADKLFSLLLYKMKITVLYIL